MSEKRKTVLFVSFFHPEIVRGGSQLVAYELFLAARKHPEFRPVLLAACDPGMYGSKLKVGAFVTGFDGREDEFLYFGYGFDSLYQRATNSRALERLESFLHEIRPSIVHFHHSLLVGVNALSVVRRACPDAKILYTLHEFVPICRADGQMVRRTAGGGLCTHSSPFRCHECFEETSPDEFWLRKQFILESFSNVDLFVAPSEFLRGRYVDWGIAPGRIVTIPNGQRRAAARESPAAGEDREKRNRFAFFGQVIDNKGLHVLLEAAQLLQRRGVVDFSVEIHGSNFEAASDAYRDRILALRRDLEGAGAGRVAWHGRYDHSEVGALMSAIDWVVVPSTWWENFPLVVSEAWMSGRPVIASDLGGLRERVAGSGGGKLFRANDAEALAETMQRCIESPRLWNEASQAIRLPISTEDAWDRHLRQLGLAT